MGRFKVLHIASWYPMQSNPAYGIFIKEHIKTTLSHSDVVVVCKEETDLKANRLFEFVDRRENGIRTVRVRINRKFLQRFPFFPVVSLVFRAAQKLLRQGYLPDLVHAHVYSVGPAAIFLSKIYSIPVIVSEHYTGFVRKIIRWPGILRARYTFENAFCVCPVSRNLQQNIEDYGIRAKFRIVPNTVDTNLFYRRRGRLTLTDTKDILFVGLLTEAKGLRFLFEAIKRLSVYRDDFFVHIVGEGPQKNEYELLVRDMGISHKFYFYGYQGKPQIAELMRRCRFFVLPSLWENLPCVLIEAMASGLPVVATNVGGVSEIVTNRTGLLVPPASVDALYDAFVEILDGKIEFYAEDIEKYANQRFSYSAISKQFEKLYSEAVNSFAKKAGAVVLCQRQPRH